MRPSPASAGPSPAVPNPLRPDIKPFVTGPVEHKSLPPMRALPGQHRLVPDTNPDPDEFPLPFAVGGGRPKGMTGPRAPLPSDRSSTLPPCPPRRSQAAPSGRSRMRRQPAPPRAEPLARRLPLCKSASTREHKEGRRGLRTRPRRSLGSRSNSTRNSFSAPSNSETRIASRQAQRRNAFDPICQG